jgi:hypothetical protein
MADDDDDDVVRQKWVVGPQVAKVGWTVWKELRNGRKNVSIGQLIGILAAAAINVFCMLQYTPPS